MRKWDIILVFSDGVEFVIGCVGFIGIGLIYRLRFEATEICYQGQA